MRSRFERARLHQLDDFVFDPSAPGGGNLVFGTNGGISAAVVAGAIVGPNVELSDAAGNVLVSLPLADWDLDNTAVSVNVTATDFELIGEDGSVLNATPLSLLDTDTYVSFDGAMPVGTLTSADGSTTMPVVTNFLGAFQALTPADKQLIANELVPLLISQDANNTIRLAPGDSLLFENDGV